MLGGGVRVCGKDGDGQGGRGGIEGIEEEGRRGEREYE